MAQLPANGGDITTIAYTVPGVIQGKGSDTFVTNGIPGAANLFTLNGADDMDPYLNINNSGASNNLLGANEVAEASVVLNAFSADYGRMSGAQVNYVGKTGTNSFHGNLFHNYNDKIFNANTFFNNRPACRSRAPIRITSAAPSAAPSRRTSCSSSSTTKASSTLCPLPAL